MNGSSYCYFWTNNGYRRRIDTSFSPLGAGKNRWESGGGTEKGDLGRGRVYSAHSEHPAPSSLECSSYPASPDLGRGPTRARCPCPPQAGKCQAGALQESCDPCRHRTARGLYPTRAGVALGARTPQPPLGSEDPRGWVRETAARRQRRLAGACAPGRRRGWRLRSRVNGQHCLPRHLGSLGCQDWASVPALSCLSRAGPSISDQRPRGSPAPPPSFTMPRCARWMHA